MLRGLLHQTADLQHSTTTVIMNQLLDCYKKSNCGIFKTGNNRSWKLHLRSWL